MSRELFENYPHRRYNPLTCEWVLVSPHRAKRPWQGQVDEPSPPSSAAYDPACYLCPGNARAGGQRNPGYESTFVFDNDFAALLPDAPEASMNEGGLLVAASEAGLCRVVCFSPDHSLSLPLLSPAAVRDVVGVWRDQFVELGSREWVHSVQIFENRGEMMGASNPHPHCQIWANANIPGELAKEVTSQVDYDARHGRCLLCDYLELELRHGERLVAQNAGFVAVAPFWAVWPFETLVLPTRHVTGLDQLEEPDLEALTEILRMVTTRYDNLFETAFPYTMGFHQRPTDGRKQETFHLHAHFYPPLLRSATVRKFMVGYEMLANPQRDVTPEWAAGRLRDVSGQHYSTRSR